MTITNEFIGMRIREARNQRKKTQSELAEYLGKTTGAISQLEMGNVQVAVVELDKIAKFLNKPIEYFWGIDYLGDDVLALIAIFRKMDFETRAEQAKGIKLMLEMQELADLMDKAEADGDEAEMKRLGVEFYEKLLPFMESMNKFTFTGNDIQSKLSSVLGLDENEDDSDNL